MSQLPPPPKLSDEVLALHPSIAKAFILDASDDRLTIVEESTRADIGPFDFDIDLSLTSGSLNPALILDRSSDLNLGAPKLVGVLYGDEAVMFSRLGAQRILAISAEPSGFDEAMQTVNRVLPTLIEKWGQHPERGRPLKSAAEAAEIARSYVAAVVKSPDVYVDEVTLDQGRRVWEVQGSYRSIPFARSRRFQLRLGGESGAVIGFFSPQRPSLVPLVTGISIILGTLAFLVWLIFLMR